MTEQFEIDFLAVHAQRGWSRTEPLFAPAVEGWEGAGDPAVETVGRIFLARARARALEAYAAALEAAAEAYFPQWIQSPQLRMDRADLVAAASDAARRAETYHVLAERILAIALAEGGPLADRATWPRLHVITIPVLDEEV